jgi:hypothetical protein
MWIKHCEPNSGQIALIKIEAIEIAMGFFMDDDNVKKPYYYFRNAKIEQQMDIIQSAVKSDHTSHIPSDEFVFGAQLGFFETKERATKAFDELCKAISSGKFLFDLTKDT